MYLLFENFVNYSSAEERVNNFYYKVQLVEAYQSKYNSIMSGSTGTSVDVYNNATQYKNSINEIVNNFDGFENFLYTDTKYDTTLSYPKDTNGNLKPSENGLISDLLIILVRVSEALGLIFLLLQNLTILPAVIL